MLVPTTMVKPNNDKFGGADFRLGKTDHYPLHGTFCMDGVAHTAKAPRHVFVGYKQTLEWGLLRPRRAIDGFCSHVYRKYNAMADTLANVGIFGGSKI